MKDLKKLLILKSKLKSFNILNGIYKSIYKSESLDFNSLREYTYNDESKIIDWKSSVKTRKLLVKTFESRNNHNILLVLDSSTNINADTSKHEKKKEIIVNISEILTLIAKSNNDIIKYYYNNSFNKSLLTYKEKELNTDNDYKNITKLKGNILFIITDIKGIDNLKEITIKQISNKNDVFIINIEDNYLYGDNILDINNKKYIPSFFSKDKKLYKIEKELKKNIINNKSKIFRKYKVNTTTISCNDEIIKKLIELLEEHKK